MVDYEVPDEYEQEVEEQKEIQEKYKDDIEERKRMGEVDYDYPRAKESETLYNLFHKVMKLKDSSKVGNLDRVELGMLNISVRESQRIAVLAYQLGHEKFGDFFGEHGEIILKTSASKKGWFTELFVSQKKSTSTVKSQQVEIPERRKKEWKMFRRK